MEVFMLSDKYYCESCGFLSIDGKEEGCPVKYCPVCNKPFKSFGIIDRIKMINYSRRQTEEYIQNKIIRKNFDPILIEKREKCYAEQIKKLDAEIKAFSYKRSNSNDSWGNYFKNFDQAKQNGATDEVAAKAAMNGTSNFVKCPYCGSCDVKKISTGSRVVSVSMTGLASKKIGKQWHCNNCNSNF